MQFRIRSLADNATTKGQISIFEEISTPGFGPPLHAHRNQLEVFHVIKGRHTFVLDGREVTLDTGDCITIPAGAPHTFKNTGGEDGILHFELLPSGKADAFFKTLVEDFASIDDLPAFFAEHDIDLLGPPL